MKARTVKYLMYALLIGGTMLVLSWFVNFLFSAIFLDSTYKLGERMVEALGLPESIG